jgi:hypothetical protein
MKLSRPPKHVGSSNASNGITRPSTAVGSTWPNPNSACSRRNVWIVASTTGKPSFDKSTHGRTTATSANWRFTTTDARVKLKRLYPQFE